MPTRENQRIEIDHNFSPMRRPDSTTKAGSYNSGNIEIETPWHFHPFHQLIYAFEGSVEVISQSAHFKIPQQFAAWIPAGTMHRTAIQNVRSGSVFLSVDMITTPAKGLRVIPATNLMREMIMYAMRWPIDGDEDETSRVFYNCFAKLCSEWINDEVKLVLPSSDDKRMNTIINYTRDHLATVQLTDVCDAAAMSPRSLRRHFQKNLGISWEDLRQRLRMYAAIEALDTSKKPIGEIAADVGYASQAAFSRAFKDVMGISPTNYRQVSP